jgi:hypothetical protein
MMTTLSQKRAFQDVLSALEEQELEVEVDSDRDQPADLNDSDLISASSQAAIGGDSTSWSLQSL